MIDQNVGKLAKLLRLLGYDTIFFTGETDTQMVNIALTENRTVLTRDTHVPERRLITRGKVKALLIKSDDIEKQIIQVINDLHLNNLKPFTLCLEDNTPLVARTRDEIADRVPPYIRQTRTEFVECPKCHRIYWKGTHWQAMTARLRKIAKDSGN